MATFVRAFDESLTMLKIMLYNSLGLFGYLPLLLFSVYLTWAMFMNGVSSIIVDRVGRIRLLTIGIIRIGDAGHYLQNLISS